MNRHALFFLALFAATASCAADATAPATPSTDKPKWTKVLPKTPPGFKLITDTIATYGTNKVELFVYVPQADGTYPCILDIHGGGWEARQIEADKPMMERLAERGFVTALIAYRLSGQAPYPAALHDCKAAVRTLRANARRYKIDPARIGVMGGSAGGHLSGLLAMTGGKREFEGPGPNPTYPSDVKACIVMAATQDLEAANREKTSPKTVAFFGASCTDKPELYRQASPIAHVRPGVPPVLFIEGEKDSAKVGRPEMQEKLRALGVETEVHTLPGAPHPFWMSQPWLDQTVDLAAAFFKKHLGEPRIRK